MRCLQPSSSASIISLSTFVRPPGTQVAFIGNTPTPDFLQWALVTIDGGSVINTTYGNLQPPAYVQWYQSPVLPDGKHTIKVDHLDGTSVDMAIISVGENTSLANKVVFVDDLDSAIQYSGSWVQDTGGFNAGTLPDGLPIGKTTHRSSTVGDTITLRFTGTNRALRVLGFFLNLHRNLCRSLWHIFVGESRSSRRVIYTGWPRSFANIPSHRDFA